MYVVVNMCTQHPWATTRHIQIGPAIIDLSPNFGGGAPPPPPLALRRCASGGSGGHGSRRRSSPPGCFASDGWGPWPRCCVPGGLGGLGPETAPVLSGCRGPWPPLARGGPLSCVVLLGDCLPPASGLQPRCQEAIGY